MNQTPARLLLAANVIFAAGCQAVPPAGFGAIYPFYASKGEATAIAAGQFGAIPIEAPIESELELVASSPCNSVIAEVRSRSGRQGWILVDSLPPRLKKSVSCATETANLSLEPTGVGEPPLAAKLQR